MKLYLFNMKKLAVFALALSAVLISGLSSCSRTELVESISNEELFSLNYGSFEEELNLFSLNQIGDISTGLCMRDGFFYIVNGEAHKIMELNSYGDLLSLYYNEDSSTKKLIDSQEDVKLSVHTEIPYSFEYPGIIAADSNKNLYVLCSVPRNRQEISEDGTLLYKDVILRLSRDGSSIDYIGQQGPGGTPFPMVKNIYVTENNELVVTTININGLTVYWYSADGFLKYMIPVIADTVPKIEGEQADSEVYVTIENVIPDPYADRLYVNVDYSSSYIDKATNVQSGIQYAGTMLYPLDMKTELYGQGVSIPPYEETVTVDYSKLTYKLPYDFLGITKNGWKFFVISTATGFDIEMIHGENQRILRRHFNANHSDILFHNMSLSNDGIISAMYIEPSCAKVVWYRTDKLTDN